MKENRVLTEDLDYFVEHFPFSGEINGRTFLVTGATGLIGSILIKCLLRLNARQNSGVNIVAMARNREKVERLFGDSPIKWIYQDVSKPISLDEYRIDYIIHLASPTNSKYFVEYPVETIRTILNGTVSVLEYAQSADIASMVYVSSLEVYGTNDNDNLISEYFQGYVNPIDVRSSYNIGKRTADCLCHSYFKEKGVPVKIARLTQTFGAGVEYNDNRVFAQFARKIVENQDIELHSIGETYRMYCYTIDAILAIFFLLINGENGEAYNVANPETYISIRDMAQFLADEFGENTKVITKLRSDMGYAPMTKLKLSTRNLELLGWTPSYSLEEMFDRLIKYYRLEVPIHTNQ